jgi:hypothetical protein
MVYFVKCTTPEIKYLRGDVIVNSPVNLALCTELVKTREAWYPDNTGKPAIGFNGCNTKWVYATEKDRDADFEWLSSIRTAAPLPAASAA